LFVALLLNIRVIRVKTSFPSSLCLNFVKKSIPIRVHLAASSRRAVSSRRSWTETEALAEALAKTEAQGGFVVKKSATKTIKPTTIPKNTKQTLVKNGVVWGNWVSPISWTGQFVMGAGHRLREIRV
jgi:hypothetical protein